ncbi:amidohydrolase family protein [soil metagenome]
MSTLIYGKGVVDGTGTGLRAGVGVLVENGRIIELGPVSHLRTRTEESIDLGDVVLLPGFVDAHTHISIRPGEGDQHGQLRQPSIRQALRGVGNVRRMLKSGVTTARVMGEKDGLDFEFKWAIASGEIPGPRLFVSGTALSASNGHGAALGVADGVDEIRTAVRTNLKNGADHIKLFMTGGVSSSGGDIYAYHYSREEVRAIVEEAHRAGRKVAAHAHGGEGVTLCAEEGVDSVEHGGLLTDGNIAELAKAGTRLVLTNTIAFHPSGIEQGDAGDASIIAKMKTVRTTIEQTFERIKASGLHFALGTDSMHGLFGFELEWLVRHGLTPEEAVIAATRHGAEVMGLENDLGTLEPRKFADIVALNGNPLEDIRAVYKVRAVLKEGRTVVDNGEES